MSLDLGDLVGRISLNSDGFDSVLDKLPGKLQGAGTAMAGGALLIGGAVAVALGTGLNDALNFDSTNRTVAAKLGLTVEESARIGALAGKLYAENYGESVEQVQSTIGNVIAGIKGMGQESDATVSAMTAKVLNYSSAYSVETADAIQMVSGLLGSGLATSAENAMDLMTAAMQAVPEALRGDMTDAITEYGPFLASLGYDGEQAFSLLAGAAEKGMYGIDKTGDALKEFTIRATDMAAASKVGYDLLGMSQEDMSAKLLAGGEAGAEAFDQIVAGLTTMTDPLAQSQAALALFGTPLEDLGVSEIPRFLDAIQDSTGALGEVEGAAAKAGDVMGGGAAAGMSEFTRKGEIMLASLMSGLLPGITAFFGFVNDNPVALQALAIGLGVVALALVGVTVATWAMNTALLANPITWIVIGIVALIGALALLVMNWGSVVDWITGAWGGFVGWFTGIMDGLLGWWGGVWDGFTGMITDAIDGILSWVGANWGVLLSLLIGPLGMVVQWVVEHWGEILEGIQTGFEAVKSFLAGIPAAIGAFFAAAGQWLLDAGHNILVGLATGIAMGFVAVWFFFTQLPTLLLNLLIGAALWLVQTGTDLINGFMLGITNAYLAVSAWFMALPAALMAFFVTAATWLVQTGVDLLNGFTAGVAAGWSAAAAWFAALPGVVLGFLVSFGTLLIATGADLLNGMMAGISNGWAAVSAFFSALPGVVIGMLASAGSWLVNAGRSALVGMANGLTSGWGTVTSFIAGIPGKITGAFSDAGTWLYDAGGNIVDGLMSGLKSMAGSVGSFFLDLLPSWIVGPFKSALGIASPSKVFKGFGVNIGEGLIGGLDNIQGDLDRRMAAMVAVPPVDVGLRLGTAAANAAGYGTGTGASSAPAVAVDARVYIDGDVGWNREELEAQANQRQLDALAVAGLSAVGV